MANIDGGISDNPWRGLNRLAFCENAILLEVKDPSQGKIHKPRPDDSTVPKSWRDEQSLRNFLDDVALIAAGPGGKDNVVAACLEWEAPKQLCLRVARNEGFKEDACNQLQHLLNSSRHFSVQGNGIASSPTSCAKAEDLEISQETLLESIVLRCRDRLRKHTSRLLGQLKHSQCRPVGRCSPPNYRPRSSVTESKENVKMLGPYNADTHTRYMEHAARQLDELRNLCHEAETHPTTVLPSTWCRISRLAYQCRGSGALRLYLKENLCVKAKAGFLDTSINEIIERIGKLARFCRASKTIATFTAWLANEEINLTVRGVSTHKIEVEELRFRTVADIIARGGTKLGPYPKIRITNMIQRWPKYRVHSELQLVIFYEEHPYLETVGRYIGGDKLCCYLCHEFLTRHGRFQSNGCHQSLYSLWMVPKSIMFASLTRAGQFHQALEGVCTLLETRVATLRGGSRLQRRFGSQNESFANLSRISLWSFVGRAPTPSKHQLATSAEVVPQSHDPLPLPLCEDCENAEQVSVSSHIETARTLSPSSSRVALDAQAPDSAIPSQPAECVRDSQAPEPESSGCQVKDMRRSSSPEARGHEVRRRRHKRSHYIEKDTKANPKRASHHRRHRHHHHRHRPEGQTKKLSSDGRSRAYSWERPQGHHHHRRKAWGFTQLVTDILRQLWCFG